MLNKDVTQDGGRAKCNGGNQHHMQHYFLYIRCVPELSPIRNLDFYQYKIRPIYKEDLISKIRYDNHLV